MSISSQIRLHKSSNKIILFCRVMLFVAIDHRGQYVGEKMGDNSPLAHGFGL